ncbi:MAG: TIR domain-containing protein [Hormoscilla sp.]
MTEMFDAFISYGRADSKAFAIKLQARLSEQGFRVWFDFNDIPLAVDFQNQIDDGIEKSQNFLFIISPHSVNSAYCRKEIQLACQLKKRIIPLLHVMEISRETWQQRNPAGTASQWEAYKAEGSHHTYNNPKMHPIISKLNSLYFQEGVNDFEKSLASLIDLLRSHTDYVEQHTQFLVKALEWERHQKQTSYLLTGEERQQGEAWLKIRFKNEQPPCTPADIHCEFITESIKNANNLMTQVFLSYADEDRATMEKIRNSLRREGITVWTNTTDIQTGEAFTEAINRGIEQADNLVYLLSPDSINSTYCQQELDLAVELNKRIIPVLVRSTDPTQELTVLRDLQYIDLTDNVKEEDYLLDESQLLKILHTEAAYYKEHKIMLTKALKWQRQQNNPSILLRGYNLRSAESWLKVAQKRRQHPPTPLQEEFITESLRQPPLESLDVFISYSRSDSDLARKLNDALQMQGKMTWFDQESIAEGTDFQQEIKKGIKACDNFLFIISPRSVNSPYCADEVEYAASLNKRFVTVLHREVNTGDLHPELAKVQWLDFNRHQGDFNVNFNQLVRTLDTDREHLRSHTKWLQRALDWDRRDKTADLLLRGSEFAVAENWLSTALAESKQPVPTALQQTFIESSHQAIISADEAEKERQAKLLRLQEEKSKEAEGRLVEEKKSARRLKILLGVVLLAGVVSAALGLEARNQYIEAEEQRKEALARKKEALAAEATAEAKSSEAFDAFDKNFEALLKALQAKEALQRLEDPSQKTKSAVDGALQQAVFGVREYNRLSGHKAGAIAVAISPDGKMIASGGADNNVILWDRDGQQRQMLKGHQGSVNDIAFSPDGELIASASVDNTVKLWQRDGTLLTTLEGHTDEVKAVAFSPDGEVIATASNDFTLKLWNRDGTLLDTLYGHTDEVKAVAFSPDGEVIATASDDRTVKLWNRDGTFLYSLDGHTDEVNAVAFSPDGKLIATASDDKTVKLWNLDGTSVTTLEGHSNHVNAVAFSPDSSAIATASNDGTVKLWWPDGTLLDTLSGHGNKVNSVSFSSDGETIASASEDNTVRLWKLNKFDSNSFLNILYEHQDDVRAVAFSPDGEYIASASDDNTVKVWRKRDSKLLMTLPETDQVWDIAFSPDGQLIATASRNKEVKVWNLDGTLRTTIFERDKVNRVSFSPNSQLIATASHDNTVKLWRRDGSLVATLEGHSDKVKSVHFSPDGKLIVSGSSDKSIKIWNESGTLLSTLTAHHGPVNDVSFSPDGQMIVSAGVDNRIKLWTRDGILLKIVHSFSEHAESVNEVVFSPDGEMMASVSADDTVKIWTRDENLGWKEAIALYEHSDAVKGVAFSPDGKSFVSVGSDNKVIWWNVEKVLQPQNNLQKEGCSWLRDYLQTEKSPAVCDRLGD